MYVSNFEFEPFFRFEFNPVETLDRYEERKKQFEEHLKADEFEKAKAILPFLDFFDQEDAAIKIFNTYIGAKKLSEAEDFLPRLKSLLGRSTAAKCLADEYIYQDKLASAERVIDQITFRDEKYQKLFGIYVRKGDWKSAKRIGLKMVDRSCMMQVLDHELQSENSLTVMQTLVEHLPVNENAAQKVADNLIANKGNLTIKDLQKIEKSSESLWSRARILILKALILIYESLGKQTEADCLQVKVQKAEEGGDGLERLMNQVLYASRICFGGMTGLLIGSRLLPLSPTAPLIGATTELQF